MSTRAIHDQLEELHNRGAYGAVLKKAVERWPELNTTHDCYSGEACRYAMLAARRLKQWGAFHLWYGRALAAYASSGCKRGSAMLVMSQAFAARLDNGPNELPDNALQTLEAMLPLLEADEPATVVPSPELTARVYYEKRAFFLYELGRFAEASAAYTKALEFTEHDLRGRLKVHGGRILSDLQANKDRGATEHAVQGTAEVMKGAQEAGFQTVADTATANLDLIRAWDGTEPAPSFVPYENT